MPKISLNRLRQFATEGLLLGSMIVLLTAFIVALLVWRAQPLNVAEMLPEEGTLGFVSINMAELGGEADLPLLLTELYGAKWQEAPGFRDKMALVWTEEGLLRVFSLRWQAKVKAFLEGQKLEKEALIPDPENKRILCFQVSFPDCFTFRNNQLWVGSAENLQNLWVKGPRLESNSRYQDARFRLSTLTDAFVYLDIEKAYPLIRNFLNQNGLQEEAYFPSAALLFPATAMSVQFEKDFWNLEHFVAVAKERMDGQAYFRNESAFHPRLYGAFSTEDPLTFSGHNAGAELTRGLEILKNLNASAHLSLESKIRKALEGSGHNLEELLASNGEFFWSLNKAGDWTLVLQQDESWQVWSKQEERRQAAQAQLENLSIAELSDKEKQLLLGADELVHLEVDFSGKSFIISGSRKVFDDGLLFRHHLTFHAASP